MHGPFSFSTDTQEICSYRTEHFPPQYRGKQTKINFVLSEVLLEMLSLLPGPSYLQISVAFCER